MTLPAITKVAFEETVAKTQTSPKHSVTASFNEFLTIFIDQVTCRSECLV